VQNLKLPPFVKIVDMVKCTNSSHFAEYFQQIKEKGGEGVVLRDPQSVYEAGRSKYLRKYKVIVTVPAISKLY
jgi:DNA ligase-1